MSCVQCPMWPVEGKAGRDGCRDEVNRQGWKLDWGGVQEYFPTGCEALTSFEMKTGHIEGLF